MRNKFAENEGELQRRESIENSVFCFSKFNWKKIELQSKQKFGGGGSRDFVNFKILVNKMSSATLKLKRVFNFDSETSEVDGSLKGQASKQAWWILKGEQAKSVPQETGESNEHKMIVITFARK